MVIIQVCGPRTLGLAFCRASRVVSVAPKNTNRALKQSGPQAHGMQAQTSGGDNCALRRSRRNQGQCVPGGRRSGVGRRVSSGPGASSSSLMVWRIRSRKSDTAMKNSRMMRIQMRIP